MAYQETSHSPFNYEDESIDVSVFENEMGEKDGFADALVVSKLLAPIVNVRNWNYNYLVGNASARMKLVKNGKYYVHALLICKYLADTSQTNTPEYHMLRRLALDLLNGVQDIQSHGSLSTPVNAMVSDDNREHLLDIKTQLGNLQDLINRRDFTQYKTDESSSSFNTMGEMLTALNTMNLTIDNLKLSLSESTNRVLQKSDEILEHVQETCNRKKTKVTDMESPVSDDSTV